MGMKNPVGEIVQVQGGHIVRSTGRKDRHSKVYTAKGPRDRRVRLSAHTAIQFYDVQDRLGYDRPSKAVDWLIKKAKTAIDKLAELPPWHPTPAANNDTPDAAADAEPDPSVPGPGELEPRIHPQGPGFAGMQQTESLSFFPTTTEPNHQHHHGGTLTFQNYAPPGDHLGLSLHPFHVENAPQEAAAAAAAEQALFGFGSGNGSFQRMVTWHGHHDPSGLTSATAAFNAAGFNNNNQRGTLQSSSSFSQLVRAWDDLPSMAAAAAASSSHRPQQQQQQQFHQHSSSSSIFGTRFVSDTAGSGGGFPVFCIPARIHGEDEGEHGVVSERPPSSSSSPNSGHR